MKKSELIVAGVMSGTSADGINVALVRIGEQQTSPKMPIVKVTGRGQEFPHMHPLQIQLLGHTERPYPRQVRAAVLGAMNSSRTSVAHLARLSFLLGELYAEAVIAAARRFRTKVELVGCHGQTLYHQGEPKSFLGRKTAVTWQTGEAAIIAATVGAPVVSDFRPADMAAGGRGAPLVPFLDYILFRDGRTGRIVQNIGGIGNLSVIPPRALLSHVIAFDTGPGNMVIDAVTETLFGQPFDRGGWLAARGNVLKDVVDHFLDQKFFKKKPPKTAGREEFGREFVSDFMRHCEPCTKEDVIATATALTARSIANAVHDVLANTPRPSMVAFEEMIVSGGGAMNRTLIAMLSAELAPLGVRLRFSDEFGVPSEAKEAMAFALLAYETWHHRASNVPSATGAKHPAVLGKISYP